MNWVSTKAGLGCFVGHQVSDILVFRVSLPTRVKSTPSTHGPGGEDSWMFGFLEILCSWLESTFLFFFRISLLGNACCILTLQYFLSSFMTLDDVNEGKYLELTKIPKPGVRHRTCKQYLHLVPHFLYLSNSDFFFKSLFSCWVVKCVIAYWGKQK